MNTLEFGEETFTGPSSWNELTYENLMTLSRSAGKELKVSIARIAIFISFYKIPLRTFNKFSKEEKTEAIKLIDFVFQKNELKAWVVPNIKIGFTNYVGPQDKLSNLTGEEFSYTEYAFTNFSKSKNIEHLDDLIAILYTPRNWFSNSKKEFSLESVNKRSIKFKSLPLAKKYSIYLNYLGCRNFIIDKHPIIYPKNQKSTKEIVDGKNSSFIHAIKAISGQKFGNFKETKSTGIWILLSEIEEQIQKQKK